MKLHFNLLEYMIGEETLYSLYCKGVPSLTSYNEVKASVYGVFSLFKNDLRSPYNLSSDLLEEAHPKLVVRSKNIGSYFDSVSHLELCSSQVVAYNTWVCRVRKIEEMINEEIVSDIINNSLFVINRFRNERYCIYQDSESRERISFCDTKPHRDYFKREIEPNLPREAIDVLKEFDLCEINYINQEYLETAHDFYLVRMGQLMKIVTVNEYVGLLHKTFSDFRDIMRKFKNGGLHLELRDKVRNLGVKSGVLTLLKDYPLLCDSPDILAKLLTPAVQGDSRRYELAQSVIDYFLGKKPSADLFFKTMDSYLSFSQD